jgi:hypothetical protein
MLADKQKTPPSGKPVITYHEEMIKGTLYRVTSVYQGKIELGKALEELTARKILQKESDSHKRVHN